MIVPILIPSRPPSPPKCPKCRRTECTKEVCRHCGFEYPEDDVSLWREAVLFIGGGLVGFWLLLSVLFWVFNASSCTSRDAGSKYERCYPLTDFLTAPYQWAKRADLW